MNSKVKYLMKNTGILTISNFSSKILVFLLVPLYTSVLTTEEYGTYDLIISTISLLYPIVTLNIVDAVMRFAMDKQYEKKQIASIGFKQLGISFFLALFFAVIVMCFPAGKEIRSLMPYIVFYYIFYVLNQYLIQLAKGMEEITQMAVAGVLGTITMLGGNLLFLLVFRMGLQGFFLANILSQGIPVVYLVFRLKLWTLLQWKTDERVKKEMLLYCTPLIVTVVGWWVNSASDKYVVAILCGVSANGILSVSYKIPQILNTFQGIFLQAWQISAIKEYGEDDMAEFYGKMFQVINLAMCLLCMILIFFSKPLASILYAKDFYVAWKYVPFLLISTVLNSASGFLGPILAAQKNSKAMAISGVAGAVVNIILNIGLISLIGIQGATIATVIASFVIYLVRKKAVEDEIKINRYRMILVGWILLGIQGWIEIYTGYWYLEVFVMGIFFVINRSEIRQIIFKLQQMRKK